MCSWRLAVALRVGEMDEPGLSLKEVLNSR
jgi:hypothetical protein